MAALRTFLTSGRAGPSSAGRTLLDNISIRNLPGDQLGAGNCTLEYGILSNNSNNIKFIK